MNVLSLFDGMSCGRIALDRAGVQVNRYYASELDKYAIKVTQENWSETIQLGDVTNWRDWDIDWSEGEKAQMVEASHYKNYSSQRFFGVCDLPSDSSAIASMRGRRINPDTLSRDDYNKEIKPEQYIEFKYDGKSNCLSTVGKDNVVVPFTLPNRIPLDLFFFRYITPIECERLQTVPDNYTNHVSNTQRYKMLGNGWTVDVIAHIFKSMN